MFSLEEKSCINESAVNRLIGNRKVRLSEKRDQEVRSNVLFETVIKDNIKDIWFDVLRESSIIDHPSEVSDSLTGIFNNILETVSKYDSKQLRENASELPWFMGETVRLIETFTEIEAAAGSSQLTDEEEKTIDDIMKITGKDDVVEELSEKIQDGIELSTTIGDKIVDYEEKELEARMNKIEDEEDAVQLETASNILRIQNRVSRNLIESIAIGNYKLLLNEGAVEGNDMDSKVRTQTLVVYSLLETINHLGLMDNSVKAIKNISEKVRLGK